MRRVEGLGANGIGQKRARPAGHVGCGRELRTPAQPQEAAGKDGGDSSAPVLRQASFADPLVGGRRNVRLRQGCCGQVARMHGHAPWGNARLRPRSCGGQARNNLRLATGSLSGGTGALRPSLTFPARVRIGGGVRDGRAVDWATAVYETAREFGPLLAAGGRERAG